jgi:hypothetical protein
MFERGTLANALIQEERLLRHHLIDPQQQAPGLPRGSPTAT